MDRYKISYSADDYWNTIEPSRLIEGSVRGLCGKFSAGENKNFGTSGADQFGRSVVSDEHFIELSLSTKSVLWRFVQFHVLDASFDLGYRLALDADHRDSAAFI